MCETDSGERLNVNADTAATAVAQALGAEKLVFLSDVNGVRRDKNDPSTLIHSLTAKDARRLIAEGHAAKLLNMRSTLLTLAGGDPMPAAAISKLLSMKTGQGYAEFGVASFGSDAVVEIVPGKDHFTLYSPELLLRIRGDDPYLRSLDRGAGKPESQGHRRPLGRPPRWGAYA